ncbi:YaaC family protein [Eleftheria terrae]|uniref:YaaC family protein n=1 Tax=Eleftheria terrae TaxID=1597781 RepID=UPI00263BC2E0|nr:YaaC family protein [Eleftheria terrae]WKB55976.1 YaaC family protein [Eleftheria terrae]
MNAGDFGVRADGKTIDGEALQAALDYSSSPKELPVAERASLPDADTSNVWGRLSVFESVDLVKDRFERLHRRTLGSDKAREVASHVAQARSYFESAASSDVSVKPLLQYYGTLAISRALILYRVPNMRESALAGAHGLAEMQWGQTLASGLPNVADLRIKVCHGTYLQLAHALNCAWKASILTAPIPSQITLSKSGGLLPVGSEFTLGTLAARVPDLAGEFESITGLASYCFPVFVFQLSPDTYTDIDFFPGLHGLPSLEEMTQQFKIESALDDRTYHFRVGAVRHYYVRIRHKSLHEVAEKLPSLSVDRQGQTYAIRPFASGGTQSVILTVFAIGYILGMFSRYFPTAWGNLSSRSSGDRVYPLLAAASNLVQTWYPIAMLREFEEWR